jgi:F-type H+-transporting ATPase subunit epsilon
MAELDAQFADKVTFELVSPERIELSEAVEMVVIPGTEGDFGVLPGHAPLISSIRPGTIRIYQGTQVTQWIFVESGFAEVTPERCTVLADTAIKVEDLDREAILNELALAQTAFDAGAKSGDAAEFKRLAHALEIAKAKLYAIDTI